VMREKTVIRILRHGQTTYNAPRKRVQGQSLGADIVLSEQGREQIRERFPASKIPDLLICSPLLRCKQTAETYFNTDFDKIGCKTILMDGLKEVDAGELVGMYVDELSGKYKEIWDLWKKDPLHFTAFPEGESLVDFNHRVLSTFSEICNLYADSGQEILIITHGGPTSILTCFLEDNDLSHLWDSDVPNLNQITLNSAQMELLKNYKKPSPEKLPSKSSEKLPIDNFFSQSKSIVSLFKPKSPTFESSKTSNQKIFLKHQYPEEHLAQHTPVDGDKNFIATLKIFGVKIAIRLNETDARGYRALVELVDDDMSSTFNREYSDAEKSALSLALALMSSVYEDLGMAANTEIAGNNTQSLTKSGILQIGNEKEPSLLHGHLIGRGNPKTCYINEVPLRGPVAGKLFNMRGDGEDEGNSAKVQWNEREMEEVANRLVQLLSDKLISSVHYKSLISVLSLRSVFDVEHEQEHKSL
jgi:broad specificity phosphatase PhoE